MKKLFLVLVLLGFLAPGCSLVRYGDLRFAESISDSMDSIDCPALKVICLPLAIPVGMAAVAIDLIIPTPFTEFAGACERTADLLWKFKPWSYFVETILFLPRVLATPFYFMGDWVLHWFIGYKGLH